MCICCKYGCNHDFLCVDVIAMTERSEMDLFEVPMFMSLVGFGMDIMFANFHVRMMLFNAMLYMLVRYVSQRGNMCFRCPMFNFRTCGVVAFGVFYCLFDLICCVCDAM